MHCFLDALMFFWLYLLLIMFPLLWAPPFTPPISSCQMSHSSFRDKNATYYLPTNHIFAATIVTTPYFVCCVTRYFTRYSFYTKWTGSGIIISIFKKQSLFVVEITGMISPSPASTAVRLGTCKSYSLLHLLQRADAWQVIYAREIIPERMTEAQDSQKWHLLYHHRLANRYLWEFTGC